MQSKYSVLRPCCCLLQSSDSVVTFLRRLADLSKARSHCLLGMRAFKRKTSFKRLVKNSRLNVQQIKRNEKRNILKYDPNLEVQFIIQTFKLKKNFLMTASGERLCQNFQYYLKQLHNIVDCQSHDSIIRFDGRIIQLVSLLVSLTY